MRFTTPQWRPSAAERRSPWRSAIDVSAFASIMFALLFLQMGLLLPAHSPMRSLAADLPITVHAALKPAALREDAMTLIITRDGMLYFRNIKIPLKDLPDGIRVALRNGSEKDLYINADARAKYADIKAVLDRIRASGRPALRFCTSTFLAAIATRFLARSTCVSSPTFHKYIAAYARHGLQACERSSNSRTFPTPAANCMTPCRPKRPWR